MQRRQQPKQGASQRLASASVGYVLQQASWLTVMTVSGMLLYVYTETSRGRDLFLSRASVGVVLRVAEGSL